MKHYSTRPEANTSVDCLDSSAVIFADHDSLGEREQLSDGSYGEYKFISYSEFRNRARSLASGLRSLGVNYGDRVGIYSFNCIGWQLTQFACHYLGAICVPVYDSLGPDSAKYIITHSECRVCIVHPKSLQNLLSIADSSSLEHIVVITSTTPTEPRCRSLDSVISLGNNEQFEPYPTTGSDTAFIMYTSGSTGKPKGCIMTHENLLAGGNGLGGMNFSVTHTDTFFSFLPLAHVYELCSQMTLICQGARIGFFHGDTRALVDDIQALKPTIICAVPRVFNRIADLMKQKIEELPPLLRRIIRLTISTKQAALLQNRPSSLLLDSIFFTPFRSALGGRIRLIVSGGAPILPDVYEIIRCCVSPNIIQGYGLTECSAAACVQNRLQTQNPLAVGPVSIIADLKLRRVPGMEYDPQGVPKAGEIMLRGPGIVKGYYKEEELTRETFKDGWFATGDVAMLLEDGTFQIIDRVKQLVKLSQGEYLSLTFLTDVYSEAKFVQFIYVYADSHHNKPVAVVVPTKKARDDWAARGITDIENSAEVKKEILKSLEEKATEKKIPRYAVIADVLIDLEEFTVENGMLTPSQKPKLSVMNHKYAGPLMELYSKNPALQ